MKDINKEFGVEKNDKRWLNTGDQLSPTFITVYVKYLRLFGHEVLLLSCEQN